MESDVSLLLIIFCVGTLLFVSRFSFLKKIFLYIPIPLWCYLLPMIFQSIGLISPVTSSYSTVSNRLFPFALALLLLGVNLTALSKIGYPAFIAMSAGALGIIIGGPIIFFVLKDSLPPESWKGVGIIAATWTGGSLNMIALKPILNVPDNIFGSLVIVDALVAYSWMAFLIFLKNFGTKLERRISSNIPELNPISNIECEIKETFNTKKFFLCFGIAALISLLCQTAASALPIGSLIASKTGWTVILVSITALLSSCFRPIRDIAKDAPVLGYPLLYLVLAFLGAQTNFSAIFQTPVWLIFGILLVAIHGLTLLIAGYFFHLPFGLMATASQANIGGVVSAPIVGAVYHKSLAPIGLIMAVTENAIGTYLGLFAAWLAHILAGS